MSEECILLYTLIENEIFRTGLKETLLDFGEDVGAPQDCRPGCESKGECDLNGSNQVNLTCIDWTAQNLTTDTRLRVTVQRKLKKVSGYVSIVDLRGLI